MRISTSVLAAALLLTGCSAKPKTVRIGVGGAEQIVYLATTLTAQLGNYEAEGVHVELENFAGGSKSLQALLGGSVDAVSGFYDHTIQMAGDGKQLRAFAVMLRYPGLVLAVAPRKQDRFRRIEDLKGAAIGVTAPGSSTHLFLNYLLSTHGMKPDDVSVTGIGGSATAVAAVDRASVDAAVMTDPALLQVQLRHPSLRILADSRTAEGVAAIYGAQVYPASVLYSKAEWVEAHADESKRLARAIRRTLEWIAAHSAREIALKMPPSYQGPNLELYIKAIENSKAMFSADGRMPTDAPETVRKALAVSLPQVAALKDVSGTFTNSAFE